MSEEDVQAYYSHFDEWGRLEREPLEYIINSHYIHKYLPVTGHIFDNGAGPGKYAIALAKRDYTMTLADLTPRLVEVAKEKAIEHHVYERFTGFHVLNAINLEGIADEAFDGVIMLGPLYHLQSEEEREQAVKELYRVTKKGGYVFVAFQSTMRMTIMSLQYPQFWKPNDNMQQIKVFNASGVFNHNDEGRFTGAYYYKVQDINPFMERNGFESIALIGSSSVGGLLTKEQWQYWEERGETQQLIDELIVYAQDPTVLGVSSHLLYIGKKVNR